MASATNDKKLLKLEKETNRNLTSTDELWQEQETHEQTANLVLNWAWPRHILDEASQEVSLPDTISPRPSVMPRAYWSSLSGIQCFTL
jgi:hypothetical protein